jgi:hypothetical protein
MRIVIRRLVGARRCSATPCGERLGDVQSKVRLEEGTCRLLRREQGVHDRTDGASNRAQAVKRKRLRAGQFRSIPLPQHLDLMEADPAETRYGVAVDVKRAADLYAQGRTMRQIRADDVPLVRPETKPVRRNGQACQSKRILRPLPSRSSARNVGWDFRAGARDIQVHVDHVIPGQ